MVYYIAIIGTRGDVSKEKIVYTKHQYEKMLTLSEEYIQSLPYAYSEICLLSGGCSFSDHIVITLFNKAKQEYTPFHSLIIFSPAKWDKIHKRYLLSSNRTAKELNSLHEEFSKRLLRNTLEEIDEIQKHPNVTFDASSYSYLQRNRKIAETCKDVLIAFGWKESIDKLLLSGTRKTWDLAKNTKLKKYFKIPEKEVLEYMIEDEELDNFVLEYDEKRRTTNSAITSSDNPTTSTIELLHFIE
jgi:hypothetical protein